MSIPIDITNQRFGRLVAVEEVSHPRWRFRCDCGTEKIINKHNVVRGDTVSCGCYIREISAARLIRHGHTIGGRSKTHAAWTAMLERCNISQHKAFAYYGGRGILVCKRWHTFENFLADMGEAPHKRSLDRIDTNGNYEPGNCRWATNAEQTRNRRNNKLTTESAQLIRSDSRKHKELAKIYGVSPSLVCAIKKGRIWK